MLTITIFSSGLFIGSPPPSLPVCSGGEGGEAFLPSFSAPSLDHLQTHRVIKNFFLCLH